ncbi:MAG: hypothetical protein LQ340_007923 [Diploschistes diacapsis]|nr:MAG: hypothetical protein LQ340_007923 [Diploschistes diacapsis]
MGNVNVGARTCHICGKGIPANLLDSHVQLCNHDPPRHKCSLCGLAFTSKTRMDHHIHFCRQQPPKVGTCDVCQETFPSRTKLQKHIKERGHGAPRLQGYESPDFSPLNFAVNNARAVSPPPLSAENFPPLSTRNSSHDYFPSTTTATCAGTNVPAPPSASRPPLASLPIAQPQATGPAATAREAMPSINHAPIFPAKRSPKRAQPSLSAASAASATSKITAPNTTTAHFTEQQPPTHLTHPLPLPSTSTNSNPTPSTVISTTHSRIPDAISEDLIERVLLKFKAFLANERSMLQTLQDSSVYDNLLTSVASLKRRVGILEAEKNLAELKLEQVHAGMREEIEGLRKEVTEAREARETREARWSLRAEKEVKREAEKGEERMGWAEGGRQVWNGNQPWAEGRPWR